MSSYLLMNINDLGAMVVSSEAGFTKGFKSKFWLKSKIKILNVEIFVIKLRQILYLDKIGFTKGLRQNLRLLHNSLKVMEKVLNMATMSCFSHFKTSYG